jgi:hypothetical protein
MGYYRTTSGAIHSAGWLTDVKDSIIHLRQPSCNLIGRRAHGIGSPFFPKIPLANQLLENWSSS